eukprot:8991324-Pyramimonas_sp.AAC.1
MDDGGYGSRPGAPRVQSISRVEIYARRQAPQTGTPPMFIRTDSQNVVDGVMAGPSWLDKRSHLHLDHWECIVQAIAEYGGLGPRTVQVQELKARATRAERAAIGCA